MELHFNELSVLPFAANETEAYARAEKLIETFAAGNEIFGLTTIRFADYLSDIPLSENFSLENWLDNPKTDRDLKTHLLKAFDFPFLDEAKNDEYLKYEYRFSAHEIEIIEKEPLGIAAAYVSKGLSLSINAHAVWERNLFSLTLLPDDEQVEVPNVFSPECWTNEPIENFCARPFAFTLEYLQALFPNYIFEIQAIDDINTIIAKKEIDLFRRLIRLLKDVPQNPFVGGLGKTEPLKHNSPDAGSKRLTEEHRIVYSCSDGKITIFQCWGHY